MNKSRLALFFDGTWNDPEDQTNVYRSAKLLQDFDGSIEQRFFYNAGVGTDKWNKILGGATGYGLSENLLEGYEWLARRYQSNDEIWIFGFSRGAYTARSLVGLIRKCGLLEITTDSLLNRASKLYRDKSRAPSHADCLEFRSTYSQEVRIHFIGVWDTVGALGIPGTSFSEKGKFSWHDTELSSIVDNAYHAMAIDEYRAAYDVAMWTSKDGKQKAGNSNVEQRWFIGAHANVGGGYGKDQLADIALHWMIDKAKKHGLAIREIELDEDSWQEKIVDSYRQFMFGLYKAFRKVFKRGDGRHVRIYERLADNRIGVNVSIDPSVHKRISDTTIKYDPPTIKMIKEN